MAYEVTKVVRGRPYRYRVQSERDETTGSFRNRWTYLGRGDTATDRPAARPRRNAREALLDALERLLEREEPDAVTAAGISAEAGLAHGTFYRYFTNKRAAIDALFGRVRSERASTFSPLEQAPADAAGARQAVRDFSDALLRSPIRHRGAIRALYALTARDPALRALKRERREFFVQQLTAYLAMLGKRGYAPIIDAAGTASALVAMIDGMFREAIVVAPLDEAQIAAAVAVIERAVFGRLDV